MAQRQTGIDFGLEVTAGGVTHLELRDDRRGSNAPEKAKAPGHATPVDYEAGKATVGGLVTVEAGSHQGMETRRAGAPR
ncbi:hypothetical protein EOA22_34150 [Mesorhizobium sp. M7A.F.Ca.US.014.04.1.1]|nr:MULTISPECIES: hypothetical protein [Mesorhizobium]RVC17092.1 hypothetical protein EN879_32050 [Mesorhizobium sp. M7A.F.Ca.AU.002.02.1.1]AMX97947.1 hypothetical protein A4R28_32735 [Mesorhizobium ciceri]MDF3233765.1 hypothetical protein [Mesorhizobium sp. DSM 30133]RUU16273.1 hypothetical protein EOC84_29600 [Mesorhizobium sp. Primo-B]RUU33580.1 hypothetical protein EOC83_31925 [Mesorhizobium sp. Primo-A]